jgi:hypothetical protein
MRLQYLLLFDAPRGVLAGDFAAAVAVAIALGSRRYQVRLSSLMAIGGLAILWENAAALFVIPVLVYVVCTDWHHYRRRIGATAALLVAAALPPLAWLLVSDAWWNAHLTYLSYPSATPGLHWSVFVHNLHHLSAYVSFFAPALAPVAGVAVAILAVGIVLAIVLAIQRRSLTLLLTTISLLVMIYLALNSSSAVESGLFLAGSRIFLPLPFAIWFLAYCVLDTTPEVDPRRESSQPGRYVVAIVTLAAVSLLVTQIAFSRVATRAIETSPGASLITPKDLTSQCAALARVYRSTGAQILATNNPNDAYGCAAEDGLNTLIPAYDRRGWLTQASRQQPLRRILVAVPTCGSVAPTAGHCVAESAGVVLVRTPPVPAARTLDQITGMHVMSGMFIFF